MITCFRGEGEDRHVFTVGILHGSDEGSWTPLRDCSSAEEAMAWISYLNGGSHPADRQAARLDLEKGSRPPEFVPLSRPR